MELASSAGEIHPMVLCMLSALDRAHDATRVFKKGTMCSPSEISAFARMEPLNRLNVENLTDQVHEEGAGAYIPVRQIKKNKEMTEFATDFVPLLHTGVEQSNAVKYVLWELIRNVLEHAGSLDGAFAAAEVALDGTIRVGVADTGIGVLASISRFHSARDESRAIGLALGPGVSGTTSKYGGNEQNGGAGLFFMKAMASLARQHMVVVSGSTVMCMRPQSAELPVVNPELSSDDVRWSSLETPFPGTAVGVDVSLRDSDEFKKLLAEIGQIYHANVRAKAREARKARFT
ncbi:MAG TPA: ATP-binding protein [Terrimesophilobacter sp.]|nr:ATP-binding protein [Terrimesophilobacter sp.]